MLKKHREEPFDFVWAVPKEGCQWIRGVSVTPGQEREKPSDYISNGVPFSGLMDMGTPYRPLHEYSALFRSFALTVPTKDGILGFANSYGVLGLPSSVSIVPAGRRGGGYIFTGEPHGDWVNEILKMREIVQLWDLIHRSPFKEKAQLESRMQLHEDSEIGARIYYSSDGWEEPEPYLSLQNVDQLGSTGLQPGQGRGVIAEERFRPDLVDAFRRGAIVRLTEHYIEGVINQKLKNLDATVRVVRRDEEKTWCVVPSNLLGALWLQLMNGYLGDAKYGQCAICGRPFQVSADSGGRRGRSDRIYCSPACKTRAFREGKTKKPLKKKRRKK